MRRIANVAGPRSQRGWIGLVVILLALVVVAWLARDALRAYGLSGAASADGGRAGARPRAERLVPGAVPGETETGHAPVAPATPLERARGVEATLQRDADERARRIDDATK